jgi:hypothetical protein
MAGVRTFAAGGSDIRTIAAIGCAWAVLTPVSAATAQPDGGVIRTDEGTIEVLPPSVGREVRTPEGFLRVESGELDGSAFGSFGTYPAPRAEPDGPSAGTSGLPTGGAALSGGAVVAQPDPCRVHRERYLRRLVRLAGVPVDRPLDLVEALTGPGGYRLDALSAGMLAGADPLRSLAWDSELRSIGRDLAACGAAPPAPGR